MDERTSWKKRSMAMSQLSGHGRPIRLETVSFGMSLLHFDVDI